jgi:hypothetical protein
MRSIGALALLLVSAGAHAGWSVSADLEYFRWRESTDPLVTERGGRFGLGWEYLREQPLGWQFAYRGEFRRGEVKYQGSLLFDPSQAVSARTRYTGLVNEVQAIYRLPHALGPELVGGLGYDYWERNILPDQREDYSVVFVRLGLNLDPRETRRWFGSGGLKRPIYVSENAHLDEIGFDQNPRLEPEGQWSLYGQVGYRATPNWSVLGYYDSYRFAESKAVATTSAAFPGSTFFFVQPASSLNSYGLKVRYSF